MQKKRAMEKTSSAVGLFVVVENFVFKYCSNFV